MRAPNDFKDFRQKVDLMLDKALSKEVEEEVMNKIKENPDYERLLTNERNFRDFVRGNVIRPKVTPGDRKSVV